MSETFTFYVVDENKLPRSLGGADQSRFETLVSEVMTRGSKWAVLELRLVEFAEALEAIDAEMGGSKFLPVFAFNNSPHNLLGNYGDCPSFGYFNPIQLHDLALALNEIPTAKAARFHDDEGALGRTHAALQDAVEEADRRGYALAVIHS